MAPHILQSSFVASFLHMLILSGGFMKSKILILLMLYVLCLVPLHAAWLSNMPYQIQQPDGSKISCLISGDEFYRRAHDAKDFTILKNGKTGFYTYANKMNNMPVASNYIVGQSDPTQLGLIPGVKESEENYRQIRQQWQHKLSRIEYQAPTTGILNNLVIFIRFSGESEYGETISSYDTMFNNTLQGANSLHNYFEEASYGALNVNTSFYPLPLSGFVVSYEDSHTRDYFEPYDESLNPNGYTDDNDRTLREHALLRDASIFCSDQIPSTLNLDGDGDGQVDNICFTISGGAGDWADLLWPHMWVLESYNVMINDKRVFTYNFQLQEFLQYEGVGVLCHEMFHSLGSPDLYHYYYEGPSPVGDWDLMEGTQNPPQHMGAYMKFRYGHWIDSIPEITTAGTYSIHSLNSSTNNCYKIASPNSPDQFYVVEYRDNLGTFESSTPGAGLLIYRIDHTLDGEGNADGPPDEVYLYRPNGTVTINGQINQANYSASAGRIAINDGTSPSGFLQNGAPGGLNISQISNPDTTMHFYVDFAPVIVTVEEGFESGNMTALPWILTGNTNWSVVSSNVYSGLYCAKSGTIGNSQNTSASLDYIIPQDGNVGFYVKTSSQINHDFLIFYIDNVENGRWSGTSDWALNTFPVTEGAHIFKWTYLKNATTAFGSDCVWIDNISFPDAPLLPPLNLAALHVNGNHAVLRWVAPDSVIEILGYSIYKNNDLLDMVSPTDSLVYYDSEILTGLTSYKVTTLYENGESSFSNEVTISPIMGNDDQTDVIPLSTGMTSIYPNPFNPETNIRYQVTRPSRISIDIYNIRGEKISAIYEGNRTSGKYTTSWQGKDDQGHHVSSGIYFVRFTSDGHHDMRKIVLLK